MVIKMKKPALRDVAKLAGVSTATVSHALNGTRFVSEEIVQRVKKSAEELQYTPNMVARGFRRGKSNTIGLILPDISNHFFSSLVGIIENSLSKKGYHLIIAITNENFQLERQHLQYFSAGVTDGIILASAATDAAKIEEVLPGGFPITLIDRCPNDLVWDSVAISSERAIFDAVSYLVQKGHKRIGFLSGLPTLSTTQERLGAYKMALKQNDLPFDEEMMCLGNSQVESSKTGTEALISVGCTAIVVCNGLMTYEAQQYLWDRSEPLMEKIDIVGFKDGYRLVAGSAFIAQPIEELGIRSAEQILYRIENTEAPIREIVLNSVFVH